MIPLNKFNNLPRMLKLRKAASLIRNAEHRLIVTGILSLEEVEYFCKVTEILAEDHKLKAITLETLNSAQTGFTSIMENDKEDYRRILNNLHHVLLLEIGKTQADWDFIESRGALNPSMRKPLQGMQVYLEDIRSPFNVGSMFRAAESFGVEKIWLSPLCADPRHKRAERTAMGCVDIMPWEMLDHDPFATATNGAPTGFSGPVFALETGGTPLRDFSFPPEGVLIVGGEELGVSPTALAAADASLGRVSIPVRGAKGSLNVSVAFGIVIQAWAESLCVF
ncbi:MAG: TrmH family RNA methyltransferase [Treponema sp.]|nr:TrmH family RNA methyltransferase [Treponema sp.]